MALVFLSLLLNPYSSVELEHRNVVSVRWSVHLSRCRVTLDTISDDLAVSVLLKVWEIIISGNFFVVEKSITGGLCHAFMGVITPSSLGKN